MAASELPARPSLEQYKKQAKDLLKRFRSADPHALGRVRRCHPRLGKLPESELRTVTIALADAQFVLAREHGFESWPAFVKQIAAIAGTRSPATVWKLAEHAVMSGDAPLLERLLRDHEEIFRTGPPRSSWFGGLTDGYSAIYRLPARAADPNARSLIAASHHFEDWDLFAAHTGALNDGTSAVARFEAAVDAVVAGDVTTLERLLRQNPDLIRARSTRTHRSTLLHYIGANGVEGFRQKTPANAVAIAETLLSAGAEVDAVADMYGGSTALGLVATSWSIPPKRAGLRIALLHVLLAHDAAINPSHAAGNLHGLVNSCLANGRDDAAELLARRGAPLDLEGAAGVGWLDVVKGFFNEDGSLKSTATRAQMQDGFTWACAFGRADVVDWLLERGMDVGARLGHHVAGGETGLHWAAVAGHVATVQVLLQRRAPTNATDATWGNTPLGWALHGWHDASEPAPQRYYEVVASLVAAGSTVKPEWLESEKVRANPPMQAALRGETPKVDRRASGTQN